MDEFEDIALRIHREENFRNRVSLIVFLSLFMVGCFLIGVGAYIAIIEKQMEFQGMIRDNGTFLSSEAMIFVVAGVAVNLFAAQLAILRTSFKSPRNFEK